MTCAICGIGTIKEHFCSKGCQEVSHELAGLWYKKDRSEEDVIRAAELEIVISLAKKFHTKG